MTKEKCSSCGSSKSKTFWDYEDGTYLCDKCHKGIGDSWAKKHNNQSKSVSGIYIVIILLTIGTLFNLGGVLTAHNYYLDAQTIDASILELEDGTMMAKSDYLTMAILNIITLLVLVCLASMTIYFLLTKNIIGTYTYLLTIIIAVLSNLVYGNIAGVGMGILIGGYIYKYLADHPHFNQNTKTQ